MGNFQQNPYGNFGNQPDKKKQQQDKPKKREAPPARLGRKKKKKGVEASSKLPSVTPVTKCRLRQLKMERIKDYLLMEQEFLDSQDKKKPQKEGQEEVHNEENAEEQSDEIKKIEQIRGTPIMIGNIEELIDENHAIVSGGMMPEMYVNILSFVDRDQIEPGCPVMLSNKTQAVIGIMQEEQDPLINVMKVEKAPLESYADIGGLEQQIQEIKEAVELPLTHPEIYEDMGIKPPKGVILYGPPGTGKTLLVKAVANETSATFLRIVGSELIQKYSGEGPRLVRQLFKTAEEHAPSIIFIDEIDAVGSKRYSSSSGGTREVQRTMLELLNQLDGFDTKSDVKVIMATNRIETLDPALIRPGRIDRKIEFPTPDAKTKKKIFQIQTSKMSLDKDVNLDEFINSKDELSGADIKSLCTEAGLIALRERRMKVTQDDFQKAKEKILYLKKGNTPEGLYL